MSRVERKSLVYRLADVLQLNREPVSVDRQREYPNLGIYSFGRGLFPKPPIDGATTSASTLYRVRAGQFIYSRLFAFEGAFGLVGPEMDGRYVSNEYPTFDVDRALALPEFLGLTICRPSVWDELAAMTVGMGHRRQRLRPDDFLAFEIELPPLDKQRAIIDLIQAVEAQQTNATTAAHATQELLVAAREHLLQRVDDLEPLSGVVERLEAGSSPRCLDRPPLHNEWGVLKTSSVRAGWFRPHEAKALPSDVTPRARAEVRDGDIVTIRASGSRRLVGAFCRVVSSPPRRLLSDYHWRVHVRTDRIDPDYLVEVMACSDVRAQIEDATTGSTTAGKVSQASMLGLEIPLLANVSDQRELVATLKPIREASIAYDREVAAAKCLRAVTLEELL